MTRGLKSSKLAKKKNRGCSEKGESSFSMPNVCRKVWQAGVDELEEGEELHYDPSAYNCLHPFGIGWPCLSFDILPDPLGMVRTEFPHTVYGVAGTQAQKSSSNYIGLFKLSNITGKKRDPMPESSGDDDTEMDSDDTSDEEDEDDNENKSSLPVLELRKIGHEGGVNRIRGMPRYPMIFASWSEDGSVQVWDLGTGSKTLDSIFRGGNTTIRNISPLIKFKGHKTEGFALDWNPWASGRLVSGDCNGCIHLWEPSSGTWNVGEEAFKWHTGSIEDLQWRPGDGNMFASCSVDKRIAIWDTRSGKSPTFSFQPHDTDINVISWNRNTGKELAAGSDDGSFSLHDLRMVKDKIVEAAGLGRRDHHKRPITSMEWSPHDPSTLAVASSDNQLSIWDFSADSDSEEERFLKRHIKNRVEVPEGLSPNLLFVHQGQQDLKEVHWHPQIPGMLLSTAADCFNVLMPANI